MLDWLGSAAEVILGLGYLGVFLALVIEGLGLPFPGDAVMAFYGFQAAEGELSLAGVLAASFAGYLTGTSLAYTAARGWGHRFGDRLLRFVLLDTRSMMRTGRLLDRYGALLLIPGRFLPGVRSASSYVAGLGRMDVRSYLLYTSCGAALWCTLWVLLGYWLGENAAAVLRFSQSWLAYLTGITLVVAVTIWLIRQKFAR